MLMSVLVPLAVKMEPRMPDRLPDLVKFFIGKILALGERFLRRDQGSPALAQRELFRFSQDLSLVIADNRDLSRPVVLGQITLGYYQPGRIRIFFTI
jgi:hypothetical protein